MGLSIAEKIIKDHLVEGKLTVGEDVTIKLDHCLLQDATGTMAWLEYEALGSKKIKPFSVQYIDHNLLQEDHRNMDDHLFLMTMASKFGSKLSLPGNGISHHVHKERFTKPGGTLIGCDSHTPTSGGSSMLAIGVGGMDVAVGMATGNYTFSMPEIIGIELKGKLKPWCTAKDIILEILSRVDVDGGKGKIYEYFGEGVKTLSLSERSTIGNMGAETGATTSIFPSDELTKRFFVKQKRWKDFRKTSADKDVEYSDIMIIELAKIEPLIALPHSPGKVKHVREVQGLEVHQAMIGSSTNSSYEQMMNCARVLDKLGKNPGTFFHVLPGSRQVLSTIDRDGGLASFLRVGARISEPSCNACIGMGNAPASDIISIRSFPRNWEGRTGTENDQVFLASPETVVATAVKGKITDPRDLGLKFPNYKEPSSFVVDDSMIISPKFGKEIRRGPNIKKLQYRKSIANKLNEIVIIKVGDDISTDHILPGGAKIMPLRSNIPEISKYVFHYLDKDFYSRIKKVGGGIIIAGDNYGQGSSREHAAIAPMSLGVTAVIAKSYARIHRANLINFGILPLEFNKDKDYNSLKLLDKIRIDNIMNGLKGEEISVIGKRKLDVKLPLHKREQVILRKGGLLNSVKSRL